MMMHRMGPKRGPKVTYLEVNLLRHQDREEGGGCWESGRNCSPSQSLSHIRPRLRHSLIINQLGPMRNIRPRVHPLHPLMSLQWIMISLLDSVDRVSQRSDHILDKHLDVVGLTILVGAGELDHIVRKDLRHSTNFGADYEEPGGCCFYNTDSEAFREGGVEIYVTAI